MTNAYDNPTWKDHFEDLDDSLDDLMGKPTAAKPVNRAPEDFVPAIDKRMATGDFTERCPACGGSGMWRGRGSCFKCKGEGRLVFRSSPEARAKGRARYAEKAEAREAEKAAWREEHKAEIEYIHANAERSAARGFDFLQKMVNALSEYGSLTDGQLAAVQRGMARDAERRAQWAAERVQAAPSVSTAGVDRLKAAFDKAIAYSAEKGLRLSPRLTFAGVTIKPAKASGANPGALYVNQSDGEHLYLGKIADGRFFARSECTPEQQAKVLEFIADPVEAAKVYGQTTGTCCICNATLRSEWKHRGIGPICAEKFGF